MVEDKTRWNHNVHYYPLILSEVPPGYQRVPGDFLAIRPGPPRSA